MMKNRKIKIVDFNYAILILDLTLYFLSVEIKKSDSIRFRIATNYWQTIHRKHAAR
jgi:hypothetical protein